MAPPPHMQLKPHHMPYWHNIISERALGDWTLHSLEVAALLARTMASLEAEQRAQRAEGSVITKANGNTGLNPRNRVVTTLLGQVLAYRRSLALTGRAEAGGCREEATRQREANRRAEQGLRNPNRPDLLA